MRVKDPGCSSPEVPRLHPDRVDVQVRDVDVAGPEALRRQFAWIERRTAMMEIVAAAVGQGKALSRSPTLASSVDRSISVWATRCTTSPSRWIFPFTRTAVRQLHGFENLAVREKDAVIQTAFGVRAQE
jgi:hypothetical protein